MQSFQSVRPAPVATDKSRVGAPIDSLISGTSSGMRGLGPRLSGTGSQAGLHCKFGRQMAIELDPAVEHLPVNQLCENGYLRAGHPTAEFSYPLTPTIGK